MRRRHEWDRTGVLPALSVVIATHNRSALLRQGLESLTRQTLPTSAFEVVIVDDGSTDDTAAAVSPFTEAIALTYARQRHAGLASARNHGLYRASGDIVLFLDDDDVFDARLLEEHMRTHRVYPEPHIAVLGYTGLSPEVAADPLMRFVTEVEGHLFSYYAIEDDRPLDFRHFWGGRTSCKRTFLLEHGVFNPAFRFGCEDIELAYRLSAHGLRVVYNSRAVCWMARAFTVTGFCDRLRRQGESNYTFSRLHEDEIVQAWTGVSQAVLDWRSLSGRYDEIVRTAIQLDRLARLKFEAGFTLTDDERRRLHKAYAAACRAAKTRGIIDARAR